MSIVDRGRRLFVGAAAAGTALAIARPSLGRATNPAEEPRRRIPLDMGWKFHLGHAADMARDFNFGLHQRTFAKAGAQTADAARADFDDSGWADVQIPHDWAVELPYAPRDADVPADRADQAAAHGLKAIGRAHPENSIGWYRRRLDLGAADRGRRHWLEFDGVFRDCLVFVNGYIVGRNESGYAPFRVDITDFLDLEGGPNQLCVRVDATLGEGWFYEGAGIYRQVALVSAAPVHIPQWGTFVRAVAVDGAGAQARVTTETLNSGDTPAEAALRQHIVAPGGAIVATLPEIRVDLAPDALIASDSEVAIPAPMLWSIETPHLYLLVSELVRDGIVVDRYETRFGIRTIRFDATQGFFLNGRPVKLLGVCNHQDHAGVGTGIPRRLDEWRVEQMREMGVNAWRSAHNPPSEALLDICDEKGVLMIDEARLSSSDPEAMSQLDRILRRDRNHPSIILWSIGNEEPHQGSARGARIATEMAQHVRRLDPTRPITFALDNSWDTGIGTVVDVIGFNYRIDRIEEFHGRFPDKPVFGSETGSTVATRGEYENDQARQVLRAYDTEHPWWSSTAEEWWTIVAERPYIAGGFIWTGFDYRGEPTPFPRWPSVSSYFGVTDLCGFPKDNFHYYRAWWRPDEPQVHLLPHWNWPGREGRPVEVWAHGNCEQVELRLNGRSLGRQAMPRNRHLAWSVPYEPGRIEALGFNSGRIVARTRRETIGEAHAVRLVPDRPRITGDGRDLVMVRVEIVDRAGRIVPRANDLVRFEITGPGRLIGVGNGDPTSSEPDKSPHRHAFNGLAQAIVQSTGTSGRIHVAATADGLRGATATIFAL